MAGASDGRMTSTRRPSRQDARATDRRLPRRGRFVTLLLDPEDLTEEIERQSFGTLPVIVEDGVAAGALPRHHADPFDRLLIAQAARRLLVLVTADRRPFANYDIPALA